jgi:hypothetical protein
VQVLTRPLRRSSPCHSRARVRRVRGIPDSRARRSPPRFPTAVTPATAIAFPAARGLGGRAKRAVPTARAGAEAVSYRMRELPSRVVAGVPAGHPTPHPPLPVLRKTVGSVSIYVPPQNGEFSPALSPKLDAREKTDSGRSGRRVTTRDREPAAPRGRRQGPFLPGQGRAPRPSYGPTDRSTADAVFRKKAQQDPRPLAPHDDGGLFALYSEVSKWALRPKTHPGSRKAASSQGPGSSIGKKQR